ncbi:unnamed protein product [Paramecium sonneborni]|uniref:Uncharacterized protein n=1 Tax=Paramecium sonneborni TaxID=65129 RepID=A0A8S1MF66_9CILI|nr:unnamed protein product [Paramecium sonneborni]
MMEQQFQTNRFGSSNCQNGWLKSHMYKIQWQEMVQLQMLYLLAHYQNHVKSFQRKESIQQIFQRDSNILYKMHLKYFGMEKPVDLDNKQQLIVCVSTAVLPKINFFQQCIIGSTCCQSNTKNC